MKHEWHGKRILVLGLGDTGLSAVRFLAKRGAELRVADSRLEPPALGRLREERPDLAPALGPFDPTLLAGMDAVVASPGIALREPLLREAAARGLEIAGDVELFARELRRHGKARALGVTGTNGKSTVTALAADMAKRAGLRAAAVGNIGVPVLDFADTAEFAALEVAVIELSSYQLETTRSLRLEAATVLNVTQDHLDRYDSLDDYAAAKARIFLDCARRVAAR